MKRIVIFASGFGTNAENIIKYFQSTKTAVVTKVLSNRQYAGVFNKCKKLNIDCLYFKKDDFFCSDKILNLLKEKADFIVLAGFLWKIPSEITKKFPKKIMNIHPSLLPQYGGKGMYGMHVHRAVKKNKELQTGITIHFVNEQYDKGTIIFQKKTSIFPEDTPEMIATKVQTLEYAYFPKIIEQVILKNE